MKKLIPIIAMLTLVAAPAAAQTLEVQVIDGRDFMVAFEINNDMTVVGDNQINSLVTAVAWQPTVGADILPGADGFSQAFDINSFGDVAGWFESTSGEDTGVIWDAATGYQTWTEIGLPNENYLFTQAFAINDNGDVALMAGRTLRQEIDGNPSGLTGDPFVWSPAGGFVALEKANTAADVQVFDMTNDGTVVGESSGSAAMWSKNGKLTDLGIPEGENSAVARAINEAGVVVGHDNAFNSDSWMWTKKDGFVKLEDFGFADKAVGINSHGIAVGTADEFPFQPVPVVWDAEGNIYNVAEAMSGLPYFMTDGVAINDNNQIVAYGINFATGRRQALVLQLTFVD